MNPPPRPSEDLPRCRTTPSTTMPGGGSKSPTEPVKLSPALPVLKPACPGSVTIAPRVLIKEESTTPTTTGPGIVTQKEWVIPPRPKPGRKPATDTPPTKRKAQNRAAQRAFRERRAARVNELEDHLKKVESDAADRVSSYRDQVTRITAENKLLRETVSELRKDLEQLRRLKELNTTFTQVASPAPSSNTDHVDGFSAFRTQRPVPSRKSSDSSCASRLIEIDEEEFTSSPTRPTGCCGGKSCGREGGECNVSSFSNSGVSLLQLQKRPKSPSEINNSKRPRFGPDLETDFTNTFMSSSRRTKNNSMDTSETPLSPGRSIPMTDSCGFCTDGTPCVCAEMAQAAAENERQAKGAEGLVELHKLPPIFPPRGSGGLVDNSEQDGCGNSGSKLLPLHPPTRSEFVGCTGMPGTCSQCLVDPMSTLFCRTLATRMKGSSNAKADGACCGGTGCGKNAAPSPRPSKPSAAATSTTATTAMTTEDDIKTGKGKSANVSMKKTESSPAALTAGSGTAVSEVGNTGHDRKSTSEEVYIPCSAAYQTLSRHRRFEEASADLGNLVGKLNTKGMQVEVSSVRDVLKYLDREFGKDSSAHKA